MQEEREKIVKKLKDRLKWYAQEADSSEFDEEEVKIILFLLEKMGEPVEDFYFNPEDSLKRFQKRYSINLKKKSRFHIGKNQIKKIVIAVSIIIIGSIMIHGSTSAKQNKQLDFFNVLSSDEKGKYIIINEDGKLDDDKDIIPTFDFTTYRIEGDEETIEKISMEELNILVPTYTDYEIKSLDISETCDNVQLINICYEILDKKLWCSIRKYPQKQAIVSERYLYHMKYIDTIETPIGLKIEISQVEDEDFFGTFIYNKCIYRFNGVYTEIEFLNILNSLKKMEF